MKKSLLSILAIAMMLLGSSCSEEYSVPGVEEDMAAVTFSLDVEGKIETRALKNQTDISDGKGADVLMYAIFDKNGNRVNAIYETNGTRLDTKVNGKVIYTNVTFPKQETILLPKGQEFTIAFWAQNGECKAYTVSDDMQLSIDYKHAINNDEKRDAFFKTLSYSVDKYSDSFTVILRRPFAQVNVGVNDLDWNAAVGTGVNISQSKAKIDNVATHMDLLTGKVSGYETVEFAYHSLPATFSPDNKEEKLWVDMDNDGKKEAYKYLSMTYLLVNDHASIASDQKVILNYAYFEFAGTGVNSIPLGALKHVPVQRNWRTNIIGQILTGNVTFKITIDQDYAGDRDSSDGENFEEKPNK